MSAPTASAGSARVFAALGDSLRLDLLSRLGRHGASSITALSSGTNVTRQAISHHLRILAEAGLVQSRRAGRETIFEVHPESIDEAKQYLDEISEGWGRALARLKSLVED